MLKIRQSSNALLKIIVASLMKYFIDKYSVEEILDIVYPLGDDEISAFYQELLFGIKNFNHYCSFINNYFLRYIINEENNTIKGMYYEIAIELYFNNKIDIKIIKKLIDIDALLFLDKLMNALEMFKENNGVNIDELFDYALELIKNRNINVSQILNNSLRCIIKTNNRYIVLWDVAKEASREYAGYYCTNLLKVFKDYSKEYSCELVEILSNIIDSKAYKTDYRVEDIKIIIDIINNYPEYKDVRDNLTRKIYQKYDDKLV